jgi:hypothetical protein
MAAFQPSDGKLLWAGVTDLASLQFGIRVVSISHVALVVVMVFYS